MRAARDEKGVAPAADEQSSADRFDPEPLAQRLKALAHPKRLTLLRLLTEPHYLEEIASELGVARQTAHEHVKRLLDAGLLKRVEGQRDQTGVTDYTVHPQRLWVLLEDLARLAHLSPRVEAQEDARPMTMPLAGATEAGHGSPQPHLVVVHGLRIGTHRTLTGHGPWLVGRDPHASVVLDWDLHASNRHFEIRRGDDGYEVVDLYSSNGTQLDWDSLPRGGSAPIENGTLLQAGKSLLLFRIPR